MKKTLLLSALAIALLTSCSKEEITSKEDCDKVLIEYQKEIKQLLNSGQFTQEKVNVIDQKYLKKYPSCKFW